ncbi:MAG TPA: PilN domain-containing protein [Thermoanaerobaculia bacterium]|nr:PilN domain-containing protein [Thermoanaerobaculia bacterium]
MIKINLVREGRAVRGSGAVPAAVPGAAAAGAGAGNLNNILIIGGIVVGALAAGGWWWVKNSALKDKQETVASKQAEADRLQAIIKQVEDYTKRKESLQKRIDLINQLKQNQRGPVKIMDRISQDLPDLVWLDKMTMSGGVITINGRGLNPNAIANFVDNIKHDSFFEEPDLSAVNQLSQTPPVYSFDMSFQFTYVPKGETTGTAGATSTSGTSGTNGTATSTTGTVKK